MICFVTLLFFTIASFCHTFDSPGRLASVPYQASIQFRGRHRCSGAIISNRFILTTMSCFAKAKPHREIFVGVGSNNWHKTQLYPADLVTKHKDFKFRRPKKRYNNRENVTKPYEKPNPLFVPYDKLENDIALVHLRYNLTLSKNVTPVYLSTNSLVKRGSHKIMMLTWRINKMHRELRALEFERFNETCLRSPSRVCLSSVEDNVFRFDIGAPIVQDRKLIALHSETLKDADMGVIHVGTSISHYYQWIVDNYFRYIDYTDVIAYFGR